MADALKAVNGRIAALMDGPGTADGAEIKRELNELMFEYVGIFRSATGWSTPWTRLRRCSRRRRG